MTLRRYLQEELDKRQKKNAYYSLRAFALSLEMDPSTLSKILLGKRKVGPRVTQQLIQKLNLNPRLVKKLISDKAENEENSNLFESLSFEQISVISDWQHNAILELMFLKDFVPEVKWIATKLGLTQNQVRLSIERLKKVGLLKISENGDWHDNTSGFTTNINDDMKSSAHKSLQEQLLKKAIESLKKDPLEERDHTAMTFAIDSSKIPEAKERIKKFRRSLSRFLSEGDQLDTVFNLNVALFPLTKKDKK